MYFYGYRQHQPHAFINKLLLNCKTYMYTNFQQNRVSISVKTVYTNLFANDCKLHKFATCNSNFEKSLLSDINHPTFHI